MSVDKMECRACEVSSDGRSIVDLSVQCVWKCAGDASVYGLPLLHIYHLRTPHTHSHTTPLEHYNIAPVGRSEQTELGQPHS